VSRVERGAPLSLDWRMRLTAVVLLLGLMSLDAAGQTYRWVDDAGRVHYSQVPPTGRDYELVGAAPPATAAPNQEALNRSLEHSVKEEPKRREQAAQEAEQRVARETRCQQARERLAALDAATARRLSVTDELGQVSRMNDEEFEKRREDTQREIGTHCGS